MLSAWADQARLQEWRKKSVLLWVQRQNLLSSGWQALRPGGLLVGISIFNLRSRVFYLLSLYLTNVRSTRHALWTRKRMKYSEQLRVREVLGLPLQYRFVLFFLTFFSCLCLFLGCLLRFQDQPTIDRCAQLQAQGAQVFRLDNQHQAQMQEVPLSMAATGSYFEQNNIYIPWMQLGIPGDRIFIAPWPA